MKKIAEIKKISPASRLGFTIEKVDIYSDKPSFATTERSREILQMASSAYASMYDVREQRKRCRRYYRGQQWLDKVTVDGETMTEEEYIQRQGKPALKQNLIRPPVRNILGQFRRAPYKSVIYSRNKDDAMASEMMSVAYEACYEMNDGKERDARQLEEFLMSGAAIYETSFSYDIVRQKSIPKFRAVNVNRFFLSSSVSDVCGEDVSLIGEIVDMTKEKLISTYASNEMEEKELRDIYAGVNGRYDLQEALTSDNMDNVSFLETAGSSMCRVIKVCILEGAWMLDVHDYMDGSRSLVSLSRQMEIDMENAQRLAMQEQTGTEIALVKYRKKFVNRWVYYHLSPFGHVLFRKVNPYEHKSHPYIFKLYPMVDGDVWSLVDDLIDQQRMVNRMIILQDFVISASAKGVLLVPEEAIPDDMDIEDFAEEWVKYNGVIKIKTKGNVQLPKQIVASNFNVGINDMINLQIKLMQDIGGVFDAMMGKSATSGTSNARYRQETANSSLNAVDYLESFGWMLIKRDMKMVQLIKQFQTKEEYIAIAGDEYSEEARHYDPEKIRNIDFECTMQKMDDNFTMRFVSEDALMKLLEMKLIDVKQYLKNSQMMYSGKLLKNLEEQQQQLAQGEMDPQAMAAMLQQLQAETPQSTPQGLANARGLYNGSITA